MIIEDEPLLVTKIQKLVLSLEPTAEIAGTSDSISGTVDWLQNNPAPDLILMDIELADGQSFEIFKQVKVQSPVIFTTAYDEFALKAFKVHSVDYLLKPITDTELRKALDKFKSMTRVSAPPGPGLEFLLSALGKLPVPKSYRDRFLAKRGQQSISVPTREISYFFIDHSIVYLLTSGKQKYMLDYILDDIEVMLDPGKFYRVNRQMIICSSAILAVNPWFNGRLKVDVAPEFSEHVIISREKASEFRAWLGE